MKDYSAMSDIEINALVSKVLYGPVSRGHQMDLANGTVDYCNNPTNAWPIIHDEMISIVFDDDGYAMPQSAWCKAITPHGEEYYGDVHRPLRSAMIVFLMMKDKCEHCGGDGCVEIKHTEFEIEQHLCHHCNKEES